MTDAIDIDLEAWDRFSDAGSLASSGASSSMGRSETPSVAESVVSLETIRAKVDEIKKNEQAWAFQWRSLVTHTQQRMSRVSSASDASVLPGSQSPNERALSSSLRGLAVFAASHAATVRIGHSKGGLQASSRQRSTRMQASPFATRL